MTRWRRRGGAPDGGFSLIEIVVVIGIMGILAAITVPSFVGVQSSTRESSTQADLRDDRTALVAYGIDNNGVVPSAVGFDPRSGGSNLVGYGWSQSADTTSFRYLTNPGRTAWCLEMTSSTGTVFRVSTNTPSAQATCVTLPVTSY